MNNLQINYDGLPLPQLQALSTALNTTILNRLAGGPLANGVQDQAVESYAIKGREVDMAPLKELMELKANVDNAIQKKSMEPDGIGIAQAVFNSPSRPGPSSAYPWPFLSR